MTTYEAITLALQSNLVLVGVLTIVVMLFVANKKK
ncbi:putative holin-like toxin [Cytobacillus sp. S13-E01]|nr:putative holin-like toxin [Cytobacillus sp. S13-E01]MDF0726419.1 putative holin-like toxin [Cytobacillus sp. S13-E01]